jgi:serine/threonine-protein kinase
MAVASRIATEQPAELAPERGFDPQVDDVFRRAFAKHPDDRFSGAADFGAALDRALTAPLRGTLPTVPDLEHALELERREPRESRTLRAAAGGAAVGALLSIAGFQVTAHLRQPDEAPRPIPSPAAHVAPEPPPVAYLAGDVEKQKPRRRVPQSSTSTEAEVDAGRAAPSAAEAFDAGAPAEPDAGALESASVPGARPAPRAKPATNLDVGIGRP